MTKSEIKELMIKGEINVTDVIDAAIELNAIIGVGLISLGNSLKDYVYNKIDKQQIEE